MIAFISYFSNTASTVVFCSFSIRYFWKKTWAIFILRFRECSLYLHIVLVSEKFQSDSDSIRVIERKPNEPSSKVLKTHF